MYILHTHNYDYYVDGLRKSKGSTYYIWLDGNMVYEFTSNDSNKYTYGHRLLYSDDAMYALNAHGDVVALFVENEFINEWVDEFGDIYGYAYTVTEVTKRYEYDAFGNELSIDSTDTNPFRYCAEYFDVETGQIYLRARYYSPVIGRFTQIDPIRDGLNWYAYCANNPIAFVDFLGLAPSALEAAYMAEHIYSGSVDDILEGGWILGKIYEAGDGMKAGAYYRKLENGSYEFSLVFAGTEGGLSESDWENNIQQPAGLSEDMKKAIDYSKRFVDLRSDAEITFIGHSKGGAEAIAGAVATNRNCITFNTAKPNLGAYELSDEEDAYSSSMIHYAVEGDALTSIIQFPSIGKKILLNRQHSYSSDIYGYEVWQPYVENHSMSSVINALMEARR